MKVIYSEDQRKQNAGTELFGNSFVAAHEIPQRADAILARLREVGFGFVETPQDFGRVPLTRVHDLDYVDFLETAWTEWTKVGGVENVIAPITMKPDMALTAHHPPQHIFARIGHYSFDATAPITPGTWDAAYASAQTALTTAALIAGGEQSAFALCRPPGHHASRNYFGGYCFFNNAAIAAQALLDAGAQRVAIIDVDYHHGNGTQSIFYGRDDVLFLSLHGDPVTEYPFFLGYADELGAGRGEGFTVNIPLPQGTETHDWFAALQTLLARINAYGPDAVVVSLGVDTFEGDPISHFRLRSGDYSRLGSLLSGLRRPTLFVMEGGYNIDMIGHNVVNVLSGFASE